MAAVSVLAWLQDTYLYHPDLLFRTAATNSNQSWDDTRAANLSGANYSADAGTNIMATNASSLLLLGSAQTLTSVVNVCLATGVLLAFLLNSHYDAIKKEWRSEYQLWNEALIIRVIFSLVCLLLAFAAAPVALAVFVLFGCYRKVVHVVLKVMHGKKFAGLMDGVDTVWALEEDTSKSVINILGVLEVDDEPDADVLMTTLREAILSQLFTPSQPCQKLLNLRRRSILGYFYWERPNVLNIDTHVRWMPCNSRLEVDGGVSEENLGETISKLANTRLPFDHASSWEILVSRQPLTKLSGDTFQSMEEGFPVSSSRYRKYPLLFRVHHAVGDGVSLLNLMTKVHVKYTPVIQDSLPRHRDGNLPDICISTGETSSTEVKSTGTSPNKKNIIKGDANILAQESEENDTKNLSPLDDHGKSSTNKVITVHRHQANIWKGPNTDFLESSVSEGKISKIKTLSSQPFEFQSHKNYGNCDVKIPCYAMAKNPSTSNSADKSISIRKHNTNMIVYFQKSLPVLDNDVCKNNSICKNEITCSNKTSVSSAYSARNNNCGDSKIESTCTAVGIDMPDLEYVTATQREKYLKCDGPEKLTTSKYSGGDFSSPGCDVSSSEKARINPGKLRCKSPILGGDFFSQNKLVRKHTPDCPTSSKYGNDDVYYNEDVRSFSPDLEIRPSSPISRPLTPTPYSLFQEAGPTTRATHSYTTISSVSPINLDSDTVIRNFSPSSLYCEPETRPATPCDLSPNLKERSSSPSCLLYISDPPSCTSNSSVYVEEKCRGTENISRAASPNFRHHTPLKRSFSPNKLKGITVKKYPRNSCKSVQFSSSQSYSSPITSLYKTPEFTDSSPSNINQITAVPVQSSENWISHIKRKHCNKNETPKIINLLQNLFRSQTRKEILVKSNDPTKLNCYVKLLSTINDRHSGKFQTVYSIWHVLSSMIYTPACLIHQILMKVSDKNPLHGPSLSGEKVVTWYSDNSMPPIYKEYRLLNTIKRIKSRVAGEVRFTDIFLTAVSSSLETYFQCNGGNSPNSVNVVVPLRMEPLPKELPQENEQNTRTKQTKPPSKFTKICDREQNISKNLENNAGKSMANEFSSVEMAVDVKAPQPSNQFSVALMSLPISPASMPCDEFLKPYTLDERIQEVCLQSELLRSSLDYRVNYWLMKVAASLLPASFLWPFLNSVHSTLVVSNMKGPSEDIYLGGYKLSDVVFWVPHRGTTGVGLSLMGYAGGLRIGLIADKAVMATRREAHALLHNIVSELRQMDTTLVA